MEDDGGIPEAERHQIAHIRELEFEELQVEEVDDSSEDDGSANVASSTNVTFNTSLASLHTYLGEVEDTRRRLAFLDGGATLTIPLFYLEGVVLFPEATLPLRIAQPNFLTAVERTSTQVDAPYIIGVVRLYRDRENRRLRFATIGTTAEIRQTRISEDGSLNVVTRGQQRFHLRRRWIDVEGVPCGEVQIIQEDLPLRTPRDAVGKLLPLSNLSSQCLSCMLPSAGSLRGQDSDNEWDSNSEKSFEVELSKAERAIHQSVVDSCCDIIDELQSSDNDNGGSDSEMRSTRAQLSDTDSIGSVHFDHEKKIGNAVLEIGKGSTSGNLSDIRGQKRYRTNQHLNQFRKVPRAFWPPWVYRMYDSYYLAQKAAEMWKQIVGAPSLEGFVKKPDLLSFYVAGKIPVSESTRQELLEIDGVSYRLRREIELLESLDLIRCRICRTVIARRSDMLVMSTEGPLGAYVNQEGYVHQIVTLYKANGLALVGRATTEYSWFPGYAWTIADCASCEIQMGWLFTATKKQLKPQSFWAIRSSQVADDMH